MKIFLMEGGGWATLSFTGVSFAYLTAVIDPRALANSN